MKRMLFALVTAFSVMPMVAVQQNWPQATREQVERARIMEGIARIQEQFCAYGCSGSSPALKSQIKQYLQAINTSVSYAIYREMVANREL